MERNKLTPEERKEISNRIMNNARKNPEYMKRVKEVVFNAQRRNLLNPN